uniref:Uncharacterized protein n=1 Tax=Cucumis melo TaxID=3656 RepID=A0A9I9DKT3_CUCME
MYKMFHFLKNISSNRLKHYQSQNGDCIYQKMHQIVKLFGIGMTSKNNHKPTKSVTSNSTTVRPPATPPPPKTDTQRLGLHCWLCSSWTSLSPPERQGKGSVKEGAGEGVAEAAAVEEVDCFLVRVTVLVRAEGKDTVREKATERSAEAGVAVEEAVVEVGEEQEGSDLDSELEAAQDLEKAVEAEAAGEEEEEEAEDPEEEMDQDTARDTVAEVDMEVEAAEEAVEEEEAAAVVAEVPQGMAPGLVLDTDRGTDPDVEDGKKKCRHESKCWTEIISSVTIVS